MGDETRQVKVGDRDISIPVFSGYKVIRGGRIVKAVTEKYPAIMRDMARFEREFEKENVTRITRAMLALPKFEELREELEEIAGEGGLDSIFKGQDAVEFPKEADDTKIIASVFPQIMEVAESELATLIALVLTPNSELEVADDDGAIDDLLKKEGRKYLFAGTANQLLEVVIVAWQVLRDDLSERLGGDSGNLGALFSAGMDSAREEVSKENSHTSSIASPAPTDGTGDESSTEQDGAS